MPETQKFILSDVGNNNNKFWYITQNDDGSVTTEYGRVGKTMQSKHFGAKDAKFVDKKVAEKIKGGYTPLRVVGASEQTISTVEGGSLESLALSQIRLGSQALKDLVLRLVRWNVHKITSSTQITFNQSTGLFQTPLGVVDKSAIVEARALIAEMTAASQRDVDFFAKVNQYLRLIPQNLGMRINKETIFSTQEQFGKQSDVLDSLEASFDTISAAPIDKRTASVTEEKVFDLSLEECGAVEFARISEKYFNTRKDAHVCKHLKPKRAFRVVIGGEGERFETHGRPLGNVMELWHGTKKANLLSILRSGLKVAPPSTAQIAGKMFGNGVYFATDSTKSLNYSYGYWGGGREDHCFMFLADVALGKFQVPRGPTRTLPSAGYNSYWAKGRESGVVNDEIIVFKNDQFALRYLVEFH